MERLHLEESDVPDGVAVSTIKFLSLACRLFCPAI